MLTNIYPIKINFNEFNIFRVKFKAGLLDELRKNYNTDRSYAVEQIFDKNKE